MSNTSFTSRVSRILPCFQCDPTQFRPPEINMSHPTTSSHTHPIVLDPKPTARAPKKDLSVSLVSEVSRVPLTLQEGAEDLASRLQQWMTSHNLQEPIQPISTLFNHFVRESVGEDLAWRERPVPRDGKTRTDLSG